MLNHLNLLVMYTDVYITDLNNCIIITYRGEYMRMFSVLPIYAIIIEVFKIIILVSNKQISFSYNKHKHYPKTTILYKPITIKFILNVNEVGWRIIQENVNFSVFKNRGRVK